MRNVFALKTYEELWTSTYTFGDRIRVLVLSVDANAVWRRKKENDVVIKEIISFGYIQMGYLVRKW